MRRVRLVIADRRPIVLQGFVSLLEAQPDFEVVACCLDGASCLAAIRRLAPDVVLPLTCDVAVRYRGRLSRAQVSRFGLEGLEIRFTEPAHAVVPGQVAVLYDGERVLGGGTISSSLPEPRTSLAPQAEAP